MRAIPRHLNIVYLSEYVMTQSLSTISTINLSVDLFMYTIFFES